MFYSQKAILKDIFSNKEHITLLFVISQNTEPFPTCKGMFDQYIFDDIIVYIYHMIYRYSCIVSTGYY